MIEQIESLGPILLVIAILLALVTIWLLWQLRKVRKIHPAIRKSKIISLNVADIQENAENGIAFEIPITEEAVEILVNSEPLWGDFGEIVVLEDGQEARRQQITDVITYAGHVVGAEDTTEVRLTIAADVLSGYVLLDDDWWFIEPLKKFRHNANFDDYLVYRTRDLRFTLDFGNDTLPERVTQDDSGVEPPHRVNPTIGMVVVADKEYDQQSSWTSWDWYQHQSHLINNVNGIYKSQLDCEFKVRLFVLDLRSNSLTSKKADTLLDQMENPVQVTVGDLRQLTTRQSSNIEIGHLTTGKEISGSTLGIAWRPGVYGLSQNQLIWIGGGGGLFGGSPNLSFQNMMIAGHEIGHNFNAVHSEADEWCVTHFIVCLDRERTIMWYQFHDDNHDEFSDGSRKSDNNNEERIRNNMATGRNRNF